MPLDFSLVVDPQTPAVVDNAVTFETGASRAQVTDGTLYAYNHHGPEFRSLDPGALTSLTHDLLLGRPMPLKMMCAGVDVDTVVALSLFTRRDLLLSPRLVGFVAQVDAIHRFGLPYLAHVDPDVSRFFVHIQGYFPAKLGKRETGVRLATAMGWVGEYLVSGVVPNSWPWPRDLHVCEQGTCGFVYGTTQGEPLHGWVEAYRRGYLWGAIKGAGNQVWVGGKSSWVPVQRDLGATLLSEVEGRPWRVEGEWIKSPREGTMLSDTDLLRVLVRL